MLKRFFKKFMTEENTNEVQAEETTPGTTPGVEVPAGAVMPGVDMTQGTSQPVQEDATEQPVVPAEPVAAAPEEVKEETATEAPGVVDPMKPVGPN